MENKEKAEKVLELIGEEGISVRKACELCDIAKTTFLKIVERDGMGDQYARAMETRADSIFDEMLEIADTPVEEKITVDGDEFSSVTRKDAIQHRRLQVDTRKWVVSRMNPKKYGDKIENVITTGKQLPPWVTGESK